MPESTSLVPPWYFFVHTVLEVMLDGEVRSTREIRTAAVERAGLSEEAQAEMLSSGISRVADRVGWAVTHSHKAGFIERLARGRYQITPTGQGWLAEHPERIGSFKEADQVFKPYWPAPEETSAITSSDAQQPLHNSPPATAPRADGATGASAPLPVENPADASPVEQIESATAAINRGVAAELLDRLRESHPDFFEEAVVKVLLAMGYGGAEQRGRRIGGTGDGGVDGVIDQDALGLDQIYVQAKRYADGNTVGRETIQAFVGALHGRAANRGVFITTSAFTRHAIEYAERVPTRVILIDGTRLAELMIAYRVGVQTQRTYDVVEIDEDFFE